MKNKKYIFISIYIFYPIKEYRPLNNQLYNIKEHLYFYSSLKKRFFTLLHLQYQANRITLNTIYYEKKIYTYDTARTLRLTAPHVCSHY